MAKPLLDEFFVFTEHLIKIRNQLTLYAVTPKN
jgi:hypothetical protein